MVAASREMIHILGASVDFQWIPRLDADHHGYMGFPRGEAGVTRSG